VSTLHTLNGAPVVDWKHHYEIAAVTKNLLRAALAEAVAMIDEERAGTKSGWSSDDRVKLERLRELANG
jgi:hypothetical protein